MTINFNANASRDSIRIAPLLHSANSRRNYKGLFPLTVLYNHFSCAAEIFIGRPLCSRAFSAPNLRTGIRPTMCKCNCG